MVMRPPCVTTIVSNLAQELEPNRYKRDEVLEQLFATANGSRQITHLLVVRVLPRRADAGAEEMKVHARPAQAKRVLVAELCPPRLGRLLESLELSAELGDGGSSEDGRDTFGVGILRRSSRGRLGRARGVGEVEGCVCGLVSMSSHSKGRRNARTHSKNG